MKMAAVCAVGLLVPAIWRVDGATLYLANPTPDYSQGETSGSLVLAPGESGTMNIMLGTSVIDPAGVAFINAFFDQKGPNCDVDVTGVSHGQTDPQWTYDSSAYKLPAEIGDECDGTGDEINEYGLVFGSSAGPGFPVGVNATYIIESLTLTHTGSDPSGDKDVFFEGGPRKPQAFGPPPTYSPFTTNDFTCLGISVPGFLWMGVGNYGTLSGTCKDAFDITKTVPEPAALSLLALGGLAALRRRRQSSDRIWRLRNAA